MKLSAANVASSPYTFEMNEGEMDPLKLKLMNGRSGSLSITAGVDHTFKMSAKDSCGNSLTNPVLDGL